MSRKQGQSLFKVICSKLSNGLEELLEPLLELAFQIAREGREGRRFGALFPIGDAEAVMVWSRPLTLNPFEGHLQELQSHRLHRPVGYGERNLPSWMVPSSCLPTEFF